MLETVPRWSSTGVILQIASWASNILTMTSIANHRRGAPNHLPQTPSPRGVLTQREPWPEGLTGKKSCPIAPSLASNGWTTDTSHGHTTTKMTWRHVYFPQQFTSVLGHKMSQKKKVYKCRMPDLVWRQHGEILHMAIMMVMTTHLVLLHVLMQ